MLKRKLKKCIGSGLLLTIVITNTAGIPHFSPDTKQVTKDSAFQRVSFDSAKLKVRGLHASAMANIPSIQLNGNVREYAADYIELYTRTFNKIRTNSTSYFKTMDAVFTKQGVPLELKYLAVVESQLKPNVISKAGAAGAWQLMPVTARYFSLKVTDGYDERMNFTKSTVAVAKYLKYLYKMFDDWLLVVAAYNGGPGTVFKAIKKSGSRNFWKMQNYLPAETRVHVKKFISTHYFFEGKGSIATMTKDEVNDYIKTMSEFVAKHNTSEETSDSNDEKESTKVSPNSEVVLNEEEE